MPSPKDESDSARQFREGLASIMANVSDDFVLTEDARKFLQQLADAFLTDVVGGATKIACHRGASNLRHEDVGFYLEHAWDMKIPGYMSDIKPAVTNIHAAEGERRPAAGQKRKAPAARKK